MRPQKIKHLFRSKNIHVNTILNNGEKDITFIITIKRKDVSRLLSMRDEIINEIKSLYKDQDHKVKVNLYKIGKRTFVLKIKKL